MQTLKLFNSLCAPAQLYLGMSILAVLVQCYQNVGNPNVFACGLMKANSPINNVFYIVFEVLYVFWFILSFTLLSCDQKDESSPKIISQNIELEHVFKLEDESLLEPDIFDGKKLEIKIIRDEAQGNY